MLWSLSVVLRTMLECCCRKLKKFPKIPTDGWLSQHQLGFLFSQIDFILYASVTVFYSVSVTHLCSVFFVRQIELVTHIALSIRWYLDQFCHIIIDNNYWYFIFCLNNTFTRFLWYQNSWLQCSECGRLSHPSWLLGALKQLYLLTYLLTCVLLVRLFRHSPYGMRRRQEDLPVNFGYH